MESTFRRHSFMSEQGSIFRRKTKNPDDRRSSGDPNESEKLANWADYERIMDRISVMGDMSISPQFNVKDDVEALTMDTMILLICTAWYEIGGHGTINIEIAQPSEFAFTAMFMTGFSDFITWTSLSNESEDVSSETEDDDDELSAATVQRRASNTPLAPTLPSDAATAAAASVNIPRSRRGSAPLPSPVTVTATTASLELPRSRGASASPPSLVAATAATADLSSSDSRGTSVPTPSRAAPITSQSASSRVSVEEVVGGGADDENDAPASHPTNAGPFRRRRVGFTGNQRNTGKLSRLHLEEEQEEQEEREE